LAFSEIPLSLEISSPNSCAPKFTQVHILASLIFLQFLGNFSQLFLPCILLNHVSKAGNHF
jgi:hypothetical protein